MQIKHLCMRVCYAMLGMSGALGQSATKTEPPDPCKAKVDQPACSYTGLNGSCTITINRLSPVTPPTIYAKTNAVIKVVVVNPSPFEDLTLDWSSTTVVVPPDTLASLLSSSVTGVVGKITIIETPRVVPLVADPAPEISKQQDALLKQIASGDSAKPALIEIHRALQPPPGNFCWANVPQPDPWLHTADWKRNVIAALTGAKNEVNKKIALIDQEIEEASTATPEEVKKLKDNQAVLVKAGSDLTDKLQALVDAVTAISDQSTGLQSANTIQVAPPHDKNGQNQVWVVNYVNKLNPVAKRVSTAGALGPDTGALGSLTDSSKQQLVKLTVQFQHSSPLEVTSGLLVPLSPYHSYAKAAVASNGTVTNNVVQQNLTYTVVPAVFIHFLAHEFAGNQRVALFGTVATGYNPASSAVEFGVGPSFGWHSIVFSGLADIGRDTDLRGGFKVGQSLGLTNAANPLTGTIWRVKPSLAVSVRIPLGGASK